MYPSSNRISPLRKPPSTRRKTTSNLGPLTRRASMNPDFDMSSGAIQEDWLRTLGIDHVDAAEEDPAAKAQPALTLPATHGSRSRSERRHRRNRPC